MTNGRNATAGDWRSLTGRWRRRAKTPQSFAVRRHIGTKEAFPDESQAQKAPDGTHDGVGTYLAIPCPYKVWDDALRPWQIVCLPPVGLIVGGLWALCAALFAHFRFTGFLAAAILTALPFLVTGFFHLDGFLDCCDAILSRRDLVTRQKILRIRAWARLQSCVRFCCFCFRSQRWRTVTSRISGGRCCSFRS